jgi:hypothetical protein
MTEGSDNEERVCFIFLLMEKSSSGIEKRRKNYLLWRNRKLSSNVHSTVVWQASSWIKWSQKGYV